MADKAMNRSGKSSEPEEDTNKKEKTISTDQDSENKGKSSREAFEDEVFEKLPDPVKKVVETGFSMQRFSGSFPNPILTKINEKHVDKILELAAKDDERAFEDSRASRRYTLTYVFIFVALFSRS